MRSAVLIAVTVAGAGAALVAGADVDAIDGSVRMGDD